MRNSNEIKKQLNEEDVGRIQREEIIIELLLDIRKIIFKK